MPMPHNRMCIVRDAIYKAQLEIR